MNWKVKSSIVVSDKLIRICTSAINTVVISRSLGFVDFSLYAKILLLLTIIDPIVSFGMPTILGPITSRKTDYIGYYLLKKSLLVKMFFIPVVSIFIYYYGHIYVDLANQMYFILISCVLYFLGWTIIESFLQGIGRPELGAIYKSVVAIFFVISRIIAMEYNSGLYVYIYLYLFENASLFLSLFIISRRVVFLGCYNENSSMDFNSEFISFIKYAWPACLAQVITILYMRMDQVLLSFLGNSSQFSSYSIASQFSEYSYTFPVIAYSILIRKVGKARMSDNICEFESIMTRVYKSSFIYSISISVAASFISPFLFRNLYHGDSDDIISIFRVLIFSLPFVTFGIMHGLSINTGDNELLILKKAFLSLVASPFLIIPLYYYYSWIGLAFGYVLTQFVSSVFVNMIVDPQNFYLQRKAVFGVFNIK